MGQLFGLIAILTAICYGSVMSSAEFPACINPHTLSESRSHLPEFNIRMPLRHSITEPATSQLLLWGIRNQLSCWIWIGNQAESLSANRVFRWSRHDAASGESPWDISLLCMGVLFLN